MDVTRHSHGAGHTDVGATGGVGDDLDLGSPGEGTFTDDAPPGQRDNPVGQRERGLRFMGGE
jgi:hypothetical protein